MGGHTPLTFSLEPRVAPQPEKQASVVRVIDVSGNHSGFEKTLRQGLCGFGSETDPLEEFVVS
jgi:hypothetical protein